MGRCDAIIPKLSPLPDAYYLRMSENVAWEIGESSFVAESKRLSIKLIGIKETWKRRHLESLLLASGAHDAT